MVERTVPVEEGPRESPFGARSFSLPKRPNAEDGLEPDH